MLLIRYVLKVVKPVTAKPITEVQSLDWMQALEQAALPTAPNQSRIMLAARGAGQAAYAVDLAKRRAVALFAMYVRTLRLMDVCPEPCRNFRMTPTRPESLGSIAVLVCQHRVPFFPIYVCSTEIADEILMDTVTFGCDTLVLGKTKGKAVSRAMEGDVVSKVAQHLPSEAARLTRDDSPHAIGESPMARPDVPDDEIPHS